MAKTKEERRVTVRLPRSKEGDVFVSVNERTWLLKRGVAVTVPACVAEVLRTAERAEEEAAVFEEAARR
ncbi:MAG: hypothetical protein IJS78_06445 [Clostridia bacterium]|nr:hypothetical protein [Clostridia bacterium]